MKLKLLLLLLIVFQFTTVKAQSNPTEDSLQTKPTAIDSSMCREQLSLYREYFKIKLYAYALPHWRWVFFNCPSLTQNIYIDGIKIIDNQIEEAKNDSIRYRLIDTLMMVYDQRIKYYGREGYVLGRKGIDALSNNPSMAAQVYPWIARSVELQGNSSEGAVLVYYLTTAIQLANIDSIDKSEIFTVYDKVISIAEHNIAQAATDEKTLTNWVNVKANIETLIEPHASCADLVNIYGKKFQETPYDTVLLRNITTILDRKNCTGEGDLFYKAAGNLHKLEPGAQSAYLMGRLSIQNNDLNNAAAYMQEAAERFTDPADKIKALYALAGIHSNNRNFSQARNTAQKILQLNPNEGKAYIIIGDLYAMSAGMCDADDLGGKTVFWAAIDKYIKAKSVDGSVELQANEKIAQYVKYYPPTSDLFFRDMQEGESYTVGCWINETTTIRGSK